MPEHSGGAAEPGPFAAMPRTRLFVDADLGAGCVLSLLPGQVHQLRVVLRLQPREAVLLFNGRDGEWLGVIERLARREGQVRCLSRSRAQSAAPDLWLLFAPIRRERTDWIAEKAAELGCRRILPVLTDRTNSRTVRVDRLQAHAREAAEQCGRLTVPEVAAAADIRSVLADWPAGRRLLFCDERRSGSPVRRGLSAFARGEPWGVLVGPEGGFSDAEAGRLAAMPAALGVSLGPRLLRADTAVAAALAVWQAALGDWEQG